MCSDASFLPFRVQDTPPEDLPSFSPVPPRQLNGGLFTGEPFWKDAPWRNFPAAPSSEVLMREQLRSANPPPGAQVLYPAGNTRPGNNRIERPGIRLYDPSMYGDFSCAYDTPDGVEGKDKANPHKKQARTPVFSPITGRPQKFAGYAYI